MTSWSCDKLTGSLRHAAAKKPRFRAEWEVSSEELCILASCFFESDKGP